MPGAVVSLRVMTTLALAGGETLPASSRAKAYKVRLPAVLKAYLMGGAEFQAQPELLAASERQYPLTPRLSLPSTVATTSSEEEAVGSASLMAGGLSSCRTAMVTFADALVADPSLTFKVIGCRPTGLGPACSSVRGRAR